MLDDIQKILLHESTILRRLDEMAHEITRDYRDKDVTVIAVLNGSFLFVRRSPAPSPLAAPDRLPERVELPRHEDDRTVTFRQADLANFRGRHVLLLDDILDSGHTLHAIAERLAEGGAESIRTCVLLRKEVERAREVNADYVGFDIPNEFVVATASTTWKITEPALRRRAHRRGHRARREVAVA